ncbi:alpha/beta hydrolase [Sporobolomyces salmoneus]|uniref:alpha/beta hydrolase n=1 Tax=Sporobolomyces salmoneus TaxID=183962 RepID=UPI003176D5EF
MTTPKPTDPSTYNHRFVLTASGNRYHCVDQHPKHFRGSINEAPTLLLCHGFPDLWYGWRYQIAALAARGYRVICPSQLGYGDSDKPADLKKYSYKSVAYDMNSLLNELGVKGRVIVLGHDWGGMVAWRFVDFFPDRVIAIASVCTPYLPPAQPSTPYLDLEQLVHTKMPNFGYQLFFAEQETGAKLDEIAPQFFAGMFNEKWKSEKKTGGIAIQEGVMKRIIEGWIDKKKNGEQLKQPVSEPEYDYYLSTFQKNGLQHPLNWYRTRRINFLEEQEAQLPPFPAHIPALVLSAAKDDALPPAMAKNKAVMKCFPGGNLTVKVIEGADHWVLQDRRFRNGITKQLDEFIDENFAKEQKAISKL